MPTDEKPLTLPTDEQWRRAAVITAHSMGANALAQMPAPLLRIFHAALKGQRNNTVERRIFGAELRRRERIARKLNAELDDALQRAAADAANAAIGVAG